ncbi:uncharacterized protein LOC111705437 isoform X2 [Eurytemora carolleeae]|uniref:uncharacterized protein LOC111705437 isoform X2 n=1 Tax=Eurytemora carolleeae TaxID=1294199 RepID=UPI000C791277|nr:uncharacterized protein LOC111705437 isoform X2 [Eurytemora carolleeae]|eukprot:XP_023333761.1 uncharacterized protein LOC111705437 isoform X2 [Eurytemora affinis]
MRIAIKEARGGGSNQTEASDKTVVSSRPGSTGEIKPPVPASKAAAVAKIRAAIAQSKSASSDDNCDKAVDKAGLNDEKKKSEKETSSDESIKPNPAREAAVGKLKAAILAAALSKLDTEESQRTSAKRTESLNARNKSQKSQNGTENSRERRRSAGDESSGRNKQKAVIWDFFEEGKKKCTCRTCGYIVNTKMNTGGLVRHLSLVHQREYREYTIRLQSRLINCKLIPGLSG